MVSYKKGLADLVVNPRPILFYLCVLHHMKTDEKQIVQIFWYYGLSLIKIRVFYNAKKYFFEARASQRFLVILFFSGVLNVYGRVLNVRALAICVL